MRKIARREVTYLTGKRAADLTEAEAAVAWWTLGRELMALGDKDVVKFRDLLRAIRRANINGKGVV